ncbi:MAG: rod shape-determining protein RodA [Clostridia bacterium]|nr:rod shape-determining protein RodA [Clostridia bacterium]
MSIFRTSFKNVDKGLLVLPFIFLLISLTMIGSTEYDGSFKISRDIMIQMSAFALGIVVFFLLFLINYRRFYVLEKLIYPLSILFLLSVYSPLGSTQFGTRGWLDLGIANLQPAELSKVFFILLFAAHLSRKKGELDTVLSIIKSLLYAAPFIVLVILQNDLGNALVYCFVAGLMLIVAGANYKATGKLALSAALLSPLVYKLLQPHQQERILAFFYPSDISLPGNYHVWQSKLAIGSGGFSGKGLFMGTQKGLNWLPVQKSDFIFAVIGEELGFIGGLIIIGLLTFLLFRILKIGEATEDFFGELIVYGIFAMFFFQVFENIGMTMGIMPVTGVTLPFLSYGGSSMLTNMLALALVINVGAKSRMITF